ncbi:hypothetical protein B0A71_21515 [Flavobacterium tructae]|uniref:Uncharacterized protein n=1 Tax=Flavobacterium tructae TaxID=1114873 RepID=A0A1S1J607_9FLAO|nr:hypothetical protein BHE19_09310 [Flavobacterium tructae]OXB14641.1 hypothetical protein B0A71_21515 [Flavobacterium tructae]
MAIFLYFLFLPQNCGKNIFNFHFATKVVTKLILFLFCYNFCDKISVTNFLFFIFLTQLLCQSFYFFKF